MNYDIDLIIPWVDGSDPEWQAEKNRIIYGGSGDQRINRFRDWDNLQFWFRGVEKFMPWVRKIHFVTWGHLPAWLNANNPKLNIVKHTDYIPEKYLPVFSSHPIEMNFHRIPELAEHFIYANDDMFFIKPLSPDFFFRDGLPVDAPVQNVLQFSRWDGVSHIVANNLNCINTNFTKRNVIKNNLGKWFNIKYGKKNLMNLYMFPFGNFTGFDDTHVPYAFLKSSFNEVWEKCYDQLDLTSSHKIRSNEDVNQWVVRYWQFATGKFVPGNPDRGQFFAIGTDDKLIENAILNQTTPMICLSDDSVDIDFDKEKAFINSCFEKILPNKCSFEK